MLIFSFYSPSSDFHIQGFDPNLIYVVKINGTVPRGIVEIDKTTLKLIAVSTSNPTVHLISSEEDFAVDLDVRIVIDQEGTVPLHIQVWNPRKNVKYSVVFGSSPNNYVVSEISVNDIVVKRYTVGTYDPMQKYHIRIILDRQKGLLATFIEGKEMPPSAKNMVMLRGGPESPEYRELHSQPIPVEGGKRYMCGGFIKRTFAVGWYKFVVEWLDSNYRKIGFSNGWKPPTNLGSWTKVEFTGEAPANATYAQVILAAGGNATYLFSDIFLSEESRPEYNLLINGDFSKGAEGWQLKGINIQPEESLHILPPYDTKWQSNVTAQEVPSLFLRLPVAFTLSNYAPFGKIASATIENYNLTILSPRWLGRVVLDGNLRLATGILVLAILAFCVGTLLFYLYQHRRKIITYVVSRLQKPIIVDRTRLFITFALLSYLLLNLLLFNVGYHTYDLIGAKIWAYVATTYGIASVYQIPATVTPADSWGGIPYAPSIFPYGPLMAYMMYIAGLVGKLFFAEPNLFTPNNFDLGFALKWLNIVFTIGDAALISLILCRFGLTRTASLHSAAFFLFNPAVIFITSVWGETHTVSIFFILASIWFAEKNSATLAWLSLFMASLTRPQLLIPSLILGIVYLCRFQLRANLSAISWSVISTYVLLSPFVFHLSPSLPIDYLLNIISTQNPSNPEIGAYFYVSLSSLNLWPLVTRFTEKVSGLHRFYVPSTNLVADSITYVELSNILVTLSISVIIFFMLILDKKINYKTDYPIFVVCGLLSLLLFRTGIANHHFILVLPLLFLCKKSLSSLKYYLAITILTITTFTSAYGDLGIGTSQVGYLMPSLWFQNNPLTSFFTKLIQTDWFITIGSAANLSVFFWLSKDAFKAFMKSNFPPDT